MTGAEVLEGVLGCLRKMLQGNASEVQLGEATNPIDDLNLDSDDGLDFADELEDALGIEIPKKINPFKDDKLQTHRTVGEIVALVLKLGKKAS